MRVYNHGGDFTGGLKARGTLNVPRLTADPTSPVDGDIWLNSTDNVIRFREDGVTYSLGVAGAGLDAEQVRDIIGTALLDSATLDTVYNDAGDTITYTVLDSPTVGGSDKAFLLNADNHTDGTTLKVLTAAERTKLAGIATAATANQTDAYLLARGNHTGTQAPATIQQATARLLGRITAATGGTEELTAAQVKTLLAIVSTDISDFAAAAVAAINAAANVDADTLGGLTAAQIQTNVTSAIVNGAQATLDTLNELAAAIGNDPNFATTMTTALGLRSRFATLAIPATALTAGVADAVITHTLNTKKIQAQVWNIVTDWEEGFMIQATSTTTVTVRSEGLAIPGSTYELRLTTTA